MSSRFGRTTAAGAVLALAGVVSGADERVWVPLDNQPFTVGEHDVVRISPRLEEQKSKCEAELTGPAKLTRNAVTDVAAGRPSRTLTRPEFELRPTGKGKVTCTVTITPPRSDEKTLVTRYTFEVK